jgi:uncharacterized membrane protein (DUF2068 family)
MRSRSLLPWIIAFKAFKAIALTALGIALLVTRHADPVDVLLGVASTIHLPVTSRLFQRLLLLVADLTITKETAVALTAFAYAILMGTEGVALYLRRPWARWFTIVATSSLIPLEVYEIVRQVHPMRVFILLANIAVVVYLWRRKDVFE